MSTIARSGFMRVLSKLILAALCALCLQAFCGCAPDLSSEEAVVEHAMKYAASKAVLDVPTSSVMYEVPGTSVDVSLLGVEDGADGMREIELAPTVVSDAMAAWEADDWAANRDDLYLNLAARFKVTCKQANMVGDIPDSYVVTCPDYVVVYDSGKNAGFVVTSTGVYEKTDDPENPLGEAVAVTQS